MRMFIYHGYTAQKHKYSCGWWVIYNCVGIVVGYSRTAENAVKFIDML